MTRLAIVLLGLMSLVSAKPTFWPVPLTYAAPWTPGTQVGINGAALGSPEVAITRVDERTGLANQAARTTAGSRLLRGQPSSSLVRDGVPPILTSPAPLGADGRVVDTPEVAAARAAHAAAHVNERINLANEVARSSNGASDPSYIADGDSDGGTLDAPEIVAARPNGVINLANEAARSGGALARVADGRGVVPLVLGNGVVAALVPVGPDGRPLDPPEVAARSDQNLANDVRSIDALAIAGPAFAYGRLVY